MSIDSYRQKGKTGIQSWRELHALRNAVQNSLDISGINVPTLVARQRLTEYKFEIRKTRRLRDAEQEKDRTLLKTIIKVWKEIKSLRDFQKFTNTPIKLYLRKEEVDQRSDKKNYEAEIEAEINELLEEYMEEYEKKRKNTKLSYKSGNPGKRHRKPRRK